MALNLNDGYKMLMNMAQDNSYSNLPSMRASGGWTFGDGLANGVNLKNNILAEAEAARNRRNRENILGEAKMEHKTGSSGINGQPQSREGAFIDASPNGVYVNGKRLDTPAQNGVYMQGKPGAIMSQGQYSINQNTMPNLYGGMYNGRTTPQNGVYMQGRTDVAFPTMSGNVTEMGNLYGGNREWYGRKDGTFDQAFRNAGEIINSPVMNTPAKTYEVDRYPQELIGLTGEDLQRAGLAYNQRIDGGNSGFGNAIQNAEMSASQYTPQSAVAQQNHASQYSPNSAYIPQIDMREEQGYNDPQTAYIPQIDMRQEQGYNDIVETPDPSIAYPQAVNVPQGSTNSGIGFTYHHNPNNPSILDKIIDDGQQFGFRYQRDPNNPSIVDRLFYNPNAR